MYAEIKVLGYITCRRKPFALFLPNSYRSRNPFHHDGAIDLLVRSRTKSPTSLATLPTLCYFSKP